MTLSTTSTLIASPAIFTSKAALAAALDASQEPGGKNQVLHDPSAFGNPKELFPIGFTAVVTNHPKRTKFAKVERTVNGWKVAR